MDRIYISRVVQAPSITGFLIPTLDIERVYLTVPATPGIACVIDPASRQQMGAQAPGDLITLVGQQLGPLLEAHASKDVEGNFPLELAGVKILINDKPVPILSVQQGLITFYLPRDTPVNPQTVIQVTRPSLPPIASTIRVDKISRFELLTADGSGTGFAASMNQDGTINASENPATVGLIVSLFGIGNTAPTSVSLGRFAAEIVYSGSAPGLAPGVIQVNFRVPNGASGYISIGAAFSGTFTSPPHVLLSVAR